MPVEKSLDAKLRSFHADPSGSREFIIADAKDADMAFGIAAPGISRNGQSLGGARVSNDSNRCRNFAIKFGR